MADVRRLVRGLRPPVLEDLGLAAALRAYADRLGPLEVEFELPPSPMTLPAAVELALYRIATEALTNVVRHAHARHCQVYLRTDGNDVTVAIIDDGHGIARDAHRASGCARCASARRARRSRRAGKRPQRRSRCRRAIAMRDGIDPMIRVLIVNNNAVFRQGMQNLFASIEDVDVCGVAGDGAAGVGAALELQPDVALMDLAMPGMTGTRGYRPPHGRRPPHRDRRHDHARRRRRRGAGAARRSARLLVKGAQQHEILDAIRSVHAGRAVIGATVARQLAALVAGPAPNDPFPDLTTRERNVLDALTAGASTTQIADRLGLSGKTVRNHISNILTKLEVVDRTQAVLKAREARLGR